MDKFPRGTLVWAKLSKFPWWPAIVLDAEDCGREETSKHKLWLFWFGDHKISEISCQKVEDFRKGYSQHYLKNGMKKYQSSVEEVLTFLATAYGVNFESTSALFSWASNRFSPCKNNRLPKLTNDLPKIVTDALNNDVFKKKPEEDSESDDDSSFETENVIEDVLKGSKKLEDICISCCKYSAIPVIKHPLFIGGICQLCKKNVERICHTPSGCNEQVMCIVCGQGGSLVYCCNPACLRAFCELCIEMMTPECTYSKILKDDEWFCYLCKSDSNAKCLIIARKSFKAKELSPIVIPKEKLPIRVIAHSKEVSLVLKEKKIVLDQFSTDPPIDSFPAKEGFASYGYKDFNSKEFQEISADLVCGGYFVESVSLEDRKKDLELLFASFYRFLFRLNNARLVKSTVFFVFACCGKIIDNRVDSRITRFLEVEPNVITFGKEFFYAWSNIPKSSSMTKSKSFKKVGLDSRTAEKQIFSVTTDFLKSYFLLES